MMSPFWFNRYDIGTAQGTEDQQDNNIKQKNGSQRKLGQGQFHLPEMAKLCCWGKGYTLHVI